MSSLLSTASRPKAAINSASVQLQQSRGMKSKNPTHIDKCLPRMSWSPANLYNLYQRTYGPPTMDTKFTKSAKTMFQQRWQSKRLVRAYHGDWINEGKFKKDYLPDRLPPIIGKAGKGEPKVPLTSLMFAELEKRLDVLVFRACLADSVYNARRMVVHGKVFLNGRKTTDANTILKPGDLVSVIPSAVTTLQPQRVEAASETSEAAAPAESSEPSETPSDSTPEPSSDVDASSTAPAPIPAPPKLSALPFKLPDYASPFIFIPPYIEPSFSTCSFIYLRDPTAAPGRSEVPSPYEADGEVMKLAWEYYAALGRKGDKKPARLERKRLGA
ncbi:hypothetical protein MNV49_000017 [Pseudohyphozyma bogoriensis]|nr:hypothetical protein MNV49_000017 [Pseudohyphozyma bogoriensis]